MGLVVATFRAVSDDVAPVTVDGATVRIFTEADVFVTEGVTGVVTPGSGEVQFLLNGEVAGDDYIVRLAKDGWSFSTPTALIGVYDPDQPPPNDNIFEYTAHEGLVGQPVLFVVEDDTDTPVEDVRVRVYDSGDLFVTEADTDASGEVSLVLQGVPDPGETYYVRLFKEGWTVSGGPTQVVQVHDPLVAPATNIFEFEVTQPELEVSLDPKMCLLTGWLVDAAGRGLKGVGIRFFPRLSAPDVKIAGLPFPSDPTLLGSRAIISEALYKTDVTGCVKPMLPRGGIFDVLINGLETPGNQILEGVLIPDAPSARLEDVLWPYVTAVTYDPTSLALLVDEEAEVTVTAAASNGYALSGSDVNCFLDFTIDDDTVASLDEGDGVLTIGGLLAGATAVQVARKAGTVVPRLPAAPALNVTPLTVTVT